MVLGSPIYAESAGGGPRRALSIPVKRKYSVIVKLLPVSGGLRLSLNNEDYFNLSQRHLGHGLFSWDNGIMASK